MHKEHKIHVYTDVYILYYICILCIYVCNMQFIINLQYFLSFLRKVFQFPILMPPKQAQFKFLALQRFLFFF